MDEDSKGYGGGGIIGLPSPDDNPRKKTRAQILEEAEKLINGDRETDYGTPQENFGRIAALWSAMGFRVEVGGTTREMTATDVAMAQAQVKMARLVTTPTHRDSWIDGPGYLALGAEIALGIAEGKKAVDDSVLETYVKFFANGSVDDLTTYLCNKCGKAGFMALKDMHTHATQFHQATRAVWGEAEDLADSDEEGTLPLTSANLHRFQRKESVNGYTDTKCAVCNLSKPDLIHIP